jgi:hypothetical protein
VEGGLVCVGVRNPENRGKVALHILPGVPAASQEVIERQITQLTRSSLITPDIETALRRYVGTLRVNIRKRRYGGGVLSGGLDIEGTLGTHMREGAVFVALSLRASEDRLARALTGLPAGCWLSPVSCHVEYGRGRGWFADWWELGSVAGSCESALSRLDEMADRRKISDQRVTVVADLLEQLALRTSGVSSIKAAVK